jgi:cytochrome c-type biogenesis protein
MSLLPEIANPYVAALAGGIVYGLVFCTSTCLPYVASYIAGINAGFRKGVFVTLIFNSGRLTAYALIGAAVGLFKFFADNSFNSAFQAYSGVAFGVVSVVIGITILFKRERHPCNFAKVTQVEKKTNRFRERFDFRAYSLGLSRGMILCAPLLALLAFSVTFASPVDSFVLAILFGLGTTLSPILILGGATGWLLNKAPLFRKWISRLGAATLIVLGVVTLINATNI